MFYHVGQGKIHYQHDVNKKIFCLILLFPESSFFSKMKTPPNPMGGGEYEIIIIIKSKRVKGWEVLRIESTKADVKQKCECLQ